MTPAFFADLPRPASLRTQDERRQALRRAANHLAHRCISPAGAWLLDSPPPVTREWLWIAGSLFTGDAVDIALANAAILGAPEIAPATGLDYGPAGNWCIFANNHAITLLARHETLLLPAARDRLLGWARQALGAQPGDRQADYQFHGYNDNMPAKAAHGLIIGGEHLGDPSAVEHGRWLLRQLREQLARRGMISEHASPTYSPLTVTYLGEIAQDARDPEARTIAAACTERLWAEILAHYHPNLGMMAGPYSRAYATDSIGQLSQMDSLLWMVLGEGVHPDPLIELTREPPRLVLHHEGDLFFNLAEQAWFATMRYAVPPHLLAWMRTRGFPYDLVATAERAEGSNGTTVQFAASEILATVHHEADFALGTSDGDWAAAQAEEWTLAWRRQAPLGDIAQRRCAFQRLLIDDERPGILVDNHPWHGEHGWAGDHARTRTVQAGRSSLVLVGANPDLAGRPLRRLRLLLAIGEHLAPIELIELDPAAGCLWVDEGPLRLGVRFLAATDLGGPAQRLRLERRDGYALAWATLYDGPPRRFTAEELLTASCGFVAEVGLTAEEDREAFRRRVMTAPLLDYEAFGQRSVRWRAAGSDIGISLGLRSWGVRFASIAGRIVERPAWKATGLPAERLPFLAGPAEPGLSGLPHASLAVHGAPHAFWAIHSRGAT